MKPENINRDIDSLTVELTDMPGCMTEILEPLWAVALHTDSIRAKIDCLRHAIAEHKTDLQGEDPCLWGYDDGPCNNGGMWTYDLTREDANQIIALLDKILTATTSWEQALETNERHDSKTCAPENSPKPIRQLTPEQILENERIRGRAAAEAFWETHCF
jgi:hypothetical protein